MKNFKKIIILFILVILIGFNPTKSLASDFVPPERQLSRVEDHENLLSKDERAKLEKKLDKISNEQNVDVIVHTTYSLNGKTPREYADDFFDYNGYGMGKDYDGIILVLSMEYRDWHMSTHGFGIRAFTDKGLEYMEGKFLGYLKDGDYYKAFNRFADLSEEFIIQAKTGDPYDVGNMPKNKYTPLAVGGMGAASLGIGGILSSIYMATQTSTHKTMARRTSARGYQSGIANFGILNDRFINSNVVRMPKPKPVQTARGGGGGSSIGGSSSGRSHGGRGGKF